MRKSNRILLPLLIFLLLSGGAFSPAESHIATEQTRKAKREAAWTEFHEVRRKQFGEFKAIDLYAENDSVTEICFICDDGLFLYHHRDVSNNGISHIEPVVHGKFIKYATINRISFERGEKACFFKLWHDETEELCIGTVQ